ncbi:hypothetical protein D3C81_1484280 [compost metagenome]
MSDILGAGSPSEVQGSNLVVVTQLSVNGKDFLYLTDLLEPNGYIHAFLITAYGAELEFGQVDDEDHEAVQVALDQWLELNK